MPRSRPTFAVPVVLGLALALVPAGALASGHQLSARAAAGGPALRITQVEYRLTLSQPTLRAGHVALEAIDRGRDQHDLRLRPLAGGREMAAPQLLPGQRWSGVILLRPGAYVLWCSLPEHARLGMHVTLRVLR